jgi:hypothetical protein
MFQDLDATIKAMLRDSAAPQELRNAEISFETPAKNFAPAQATVNLFLYEVKENAGLRDSVPIMEMSGATYIRRQPPMRVDCAYMLTTWSNQVGAAKVAEEHLLLAQAFLWLSRFSTVPPAYFAGGLKNQPFPPPTMVAQTDGNKNISEFWTALGTPPRPAFYVVVTIAMALGLQRPAGPPVISKQTRLKQMAATGDQEVVIEIGGRIQDASSLAGIPEAQVMLTDTGQIVMTDPEGRFRLQRVQAGTYTLRAMAPGYSPREARLEVPNRQRGDYEIKLTPSRR